MVCFVVCFRLWMLTLFRSTGVPVAWMMTSNGTEATIHFFLKFVTDCNLEIKPQFTMSDCDQVQLNAIKAVYLETKLLLCWWHVLRACYVWTTCTIRLNLR